MTKGALGDHVSEQRGVVYAVPCVGYARDKPISTHLSIKKYVSLRIWTTRGSEEVYLSEIFTEHEINFT